MTNTPERNDSKKSNPYLPNRRQIEDRRSFEPSGPFPIVDCAGKAVKEDRRTRPDRRIANIQVTGHFLHIKNDLLKKFIEI